MAFSDIVNYILYGISGFCFGIFASRYSVFAAVKIAAAVKGSGLAGIIASLPQLVFLIFCFFLFPVWFISRTTTGGFFYCAVLVYFFSKGYRMHIRNR